VKSNRSDVTFIEVLIDLKDIAFIVECRIEGSVKRR